MKRYVLKRILMAFLVLIGVSILSFLLIALSGKDPAQFIAAKSGMSADTAYVEQLREQMGLNLPLYVRYFNWLKGLFTGELGTSVVTFHPISADIIKYAPVSLKLTLLSLLFIIIMFFPASIISVRFHNRLPDHIIRILTIAGICLPTFWLGFMLLLGFAVNMPIFTVLPKPGIKGYILPAITLALPNACGVVRIFRASLLKEYNSDYAAYAKARGLGTTRILMTHALRNSLPPVITMSAQYLGYMLAGSAVVESVFSLDGLGNYLVGAVTACDSTTVATCVILIAAVFVFCNLTADIVNRLLCPWMVRESND